ncbi:MAG: hypothetical protein ACRYGA_00990 [Janthinobacterium lividum]
MATNNLPLDAIAAIDQGDVVEAVQRVLRHTGLGIAEARDAVDRYRNGDRSALASVAAASAASAADAARTEATAQRDPIFDAFASTPLAQSSAASMRNDPMAEPGRVRGSAWSAPLVWSIASTGALLLWFHLSGRF